MRGGFALFAFAMRPSHLSDRMVRSVGIPSLRSAPAAPPWPTQHYLPTGTARKHFFALALGVRLSA